MTFAAGDLGGGVKAQGSGDAGLAGQGQAGQTSRGLFAPGREPNSRSGAVTAVALAIQVAAQIGGAARGVPKQRRLRKVIQTIPGAVLDRRFRAGLAAEGSFEDEHRSLPSRACVYPDAGKARPNPTYAAEVTAMDPKGEQTAFVYTT